MNVVFDANVVAAAVGWQGEGFRCLLKVARRRCFVFGTEETVDETRETCLRLIREHRFKHNAAGRLDFYLDRVRLVTPAPLGKRRSRDAKDDPYLAAALGASAKAIVTYDGDLLDLGSPFGLRILRPAAFLALLV